MLRFVVALVPFMVRRFVMPPLLGEIILETLKIVRIAMEGQPLEVRQRLWELYLQDLERWRTFWDKVLNLKALDT